MTPLPDNVIEYSKKAAESFIQTAVFIDDRIYKGATKTLAPKAPIEAPKSRKRAIKSAEKNDKLETNQKQDPVEEDPSPDTYDIVHYFAKKQIVCSLYQPKQDASVAPQSDIFPLCKAADIVIVDWDLYGDKGKKAQELVDGLIKQAVEDVPEQLRLILIYTQELNLQAVANEIYETVYKSIGDVFQPVDGDEGLVFYTQNSRVVVLGKPGRERPEPYARFTVNEKDLADVAIGEFAKLASGILHAATLMGLAEIRKNSRKILSKFNSNLDPAFLTHLAMCLPLEDASSHVIPLLVSEIESVLEDVLPTPLLSTKLIENWVDSVWKPGDHLETLFEKKGVDYRSVAKILCTKGFKEAIKQEDKVPNINAEKDKTKKIRKAAQILMPSAESDTNQRFSHLMASRTFYGGKAKALKLGSVVYNRERDRFLLCVQPICDSVRLRYERIFVFLQMEKSNGGSSDGASHIVIKADDTVQELVYQAKSYRCFTASFKPDIGSGEVLAYTDEQGDLVFEDIVGSKYYWADQLRTSHAQRAVEQFASDLSRVGLTESEWLRRLEPK
ncbi:MAG: hypothetical protein COA78_16290 [Blastopirellula sp.]|nr:MAG: hypothetical protein COA78_16290 [Blastopirellula sp.]